MNSIRKEDIEHIISRMPCELCDNQTFLITGANGFLARYMVDSLMYLNKKRIITGCSVIAVCRNEEKAKRVFKEWLGCEGFRLLVQSVEEIASIQGPIDYIIHAASCSSTQQFNSRPVDLLEANTIGCYNLLKIAKEKRVKGFLFFSSGTVYGSDNVDVKELREEELYHIDYLDMRNSYACSKRMGEALCIAFWKQYRVPAKGVRISHTYGPGIDLNDGHVYSDFARDIIQYKDLVINGDGLAVRPFCYVTDAICAFWLVLFKGECGEMYNMANSNETFSIKELADILARDLFADRGLNVIVKKTSNGSTGYRTMVNTKKLEKLGWKPMVDIKTGFERLIGSLEKEI